MDPLDDIVRDAMRALEGGATPRDYFDQLPDRIHVRLEGSMQTEPHDDDARSPSDGVVHADAQARDDSGLHDIKALAQTTRNRISRRQTSQHDLDETLLSASQSGLHAVALPDPAKMVQLPSVEEARALARSTGGMAAVAVDEVEAPARVAVAAPAAPRGKGIPVWVWAGGGLAAAAAVVAVVVLGGQSGASDPAKREPAVAQGATETAKSEAAPMAPAPARDDGITTGGLAEGAAGAPTPAADPEAVAVAAIEQEETAKPDDATQRLRAEKKGRAEEPKKDVRGKVDAKVDAKDAKDDKKAKDDTKAPPPDKKQLDGAVLGAGDSDELGIGDALGSGGKKKDTGPSKTELTGQELRDGLDAINGKAKACYGAHGQTGTVKVKLTIAPSGKVSKASASGALAGTPAADCVLAAVKSATFPAWEGSPKSTSYVVLLSD